MVPRGMRGRSGCRLDGPPRYRRCIPTRSAVHDFPYPSRCPMCIHTHIRLKIYIVSPLEGCAAALAGLNDSGRASAKALRRRRRRHRHQSRTNLRPLLAANSLFNIIYYKAHNYSYNCNCSVILCTSCWVILYNTLCMNSGHFPSPSDCFGLVGHLYPNICSIIYYVKPICLPAI